MATVKVKTDDLDGSTATQVIKFTVHGKTYALDVNDVHAAEFAADIDGWLKVAAEKASKARSKPAEKQAKPEPVMLHGRQVTKEEVRAWAKEQGLKVGDFFVPPKLYEAYVTAKQAEEAATEPEGDETPQDEGGDD